MSEELFDQEHEEVTTKPYCVFYNDGSYVVYDLTPEDYQKIKDGIMCNKRAAEISTGLLRMCDIRSVIVQRPVQENKAINPMLTDDEIVWLEQVKRANELAEGVENNEYDF